MKKLSKEKRSQITLSIVIVLVVIAGLWSFLIKYQRNGLEALATKKAASENKAARVDEIIRNREKIEARLNVVSNELALAESSMASGDLYSFMVGAVRKFKQSYDVDIPKFDSAGTEAPVDLMPRFPYKQVRLSVEGTAHYYELGRFISDYENQFPSSRIVNLDISRASAANVEDREKLAFRMDMIFLVKSDLIPATQSRK